MGRRYLGVCMLLMIMLFIPLTATADEPEKAIKTEYVFLISVDGYNYEGYNSIPTSNIRYLASDGVIDEKTMCIRADTMEAAEATLLTGTMPEEHKHLTATDKVAVESVVDVIKKNNLGFAVIDGSGGKLQTFARSDKEYIKLKSADSDAQVMDAAIKYFNQNKPFLTYIYLNDCLDALMRADKKTYNQALTKFDRAMGVFVDNLMKQNIYNQSLIIVTAPRSSSASNSAPLIIHGPKCKQNVRISGNLIIDVIPTICRILGLDKPYSAEGVPIYEALQVAEQDQPYLSTRWVKELKGERIANWNQYYDLKDELYRTIHQMTSIKEEKQSIFDFAGEREQLLNQLQQRISRERLIFLGIILLMAGGYLLEYFWLKKKFLLFN